MSEESDITKNLRAIAARLRSVDLVAPVALRTRWSLDIETAASRLGGDGRWGGISDPELEFLGFAVDYWSRRYSFTSTKRALAESLSRELTRRGRRVPVWTEKEHTFVGLGTEDLKTLLAWGQQATKQGGTDERGLLRSLQEELDYWREET